MKALADCLIAFELRGLNGEEYEDQRAVAADHAEVGMRRELSEFRRYASLQLRGCRTFHWPVEFPEGFTRGGLSAFVGNPPFLGGKRITTIHGDEYATAIRRAVLQDKGAADLAAYFLVRAHHLLETNGHLGLVLTNSINEGDTRELGLSAVKSMNGTIRRVRTNMPWPPQVGITVSTLILAKGSWRGERLLNVSVLGTPPSPW